MEDANMINKSACCMIDYAGGRATQGAVAEVELRLEQ